MVSNILSQSEYVGIARNSVMRFQENLPSRCRINLDMITFEHCKGSYVPVLAKFMTAAKEVVMGAALNTQGRFLHQGRTVLAAPTAEPKERNVAAGVESKPKPPPLFALILVGTPADRKIAIIRTVREIGPDLGLAEAKEIVETPQATLLTGVSESQARAAKEKLERAGGRARLDQMTQT